MPDIQDQLNVSQRILNERYEMNVLYLDEDGFFKEQEAVKITATGIIDRIANGIAKIKLTNIEILGEDGKGARSELAALLDGDGSIIRGRDA